MEELLCGTVRSVNIAFHYHPHKPRLLLPLTPPQKLFTVEACSRRWGAGRRAQPQCTSTTLGSRGALEGAALLPTLATCGLTRPEGERVRRARQHRGAQDWDGQQRGGRVHKVATGERASQTCENCSRHVAADIA
eukprot:6208916-Pleurochrysis_carterae.AAC.9